MSKVIVAVVYELPDCPVCDERFIAQERTPEGRRHCINGHRWLRHEKVSVPLGSPIGKHFKRET